ncbi:MAG: hypothetical protein ACR2GQ_03820 [Gemmatimonadota bacterium]
MRWTMGAALSLVALSLLGVAACGGADGEGDGRARDAADADSAAVAEAGTNEAPARGGDTTTLSATRGAAKASDADPFQGFDLPSENGTGEMLRYRLRLRNDGDSLAIVYADGGAGEVLLDTVPPGSWRPVEVDSRARRVRLRSVTPGGDLLRETELGVPADTVIDLAVGSRAPAE